MNIFLDTSSLFKLYHKEAGTEELEQLFEDGFSGRNHDDRVYVCGMAKMENERS